MYYGEGFCQNINVKVNKKCTNYAYYKHNNKYLCGVHSRKFKDRETLPKNPKHKENIEKKLLEEKKIIEEYAENNRNNNKIGDVTVSKLRMMKKPDDITGYLKVFPNFKHQNRKDGFGCSSLSPKSLGPVKHKMPNLPTAQNIENYHQFAKVFKFELDNDEKILEIRRKGYESKVPKRHKYPADVLKKYGKNINIPAYSSYYDKDGNEHQYNYLECRYFYCYWYEKLAKKTDDFKILTDKIKNGYNLQIIGYDGYKPTNNMYQCYLDTNRPFGHEMVLYCLLTMDKQEYPWRVFYKENKKIYKNVI
jgi:hypothetical protein